MDKDFIIEESTDFETMARNALGDLVDDDEFECLMEDFYALM